MNKQKYQHHTAEGSDPGDERRLLMSPPFVSFISAEATRCAASLVRSGLFRWDEFDDLSQELLLDLLIRLRRWTPSRGELYSFARLVLRHRKTVLWSTATRKGHRVFQIHLSGWEEVATHSLRLDKPGTSSYTTIDMQRAISRLPEPLRDLARDLEVH